MKIFLPGTFTVPYGATVETSWAALRKLVCPRAPYLCHIAVSNSYRSKKSWNKANAGGQFGYHGGYEQSEWMCSYWWKPTKFNLNSQICCDFDELRSLLSTYATKSIKGSCGKIWLIDRACQNPPECTTDWTSFLMASVSRWWMGSGAARCIQTSPAKALCLMTPAKRAEVGSSIRGPAVITIYKRITPSSC